MVLNPDVRALLQTKEFNQNWLVDDLDYIKVQASMPGINTLRTRPGLAVDATVVSGPSERLEKLSPYMVRGMPLPAVGLNL